MFIKKDVISQMLSLHPLLRLKNHVSNKGNNSKKEFEMKSATSRLQLNKKWTPSGIFQRFCLVFKLFCLNGLLYRNLSRISRICIFRNTFPRLLLVKRNLIFQHAPFSNSSTIFCHALLFISFLWKCEWDLSYRTGNW